MGALPSGSGPGGRSGDRVAARGGGRSVKSPPRFVGHIDGASGRTAVRGVSQSLGSKPGTGGYGLLWLPCVS